MNWLLVIIGGAVGAPLRYLTDRAVQARHGAGLPYVFPWGTFTVNAAGGLLLGVLTGATVSTPVYALLGTGMCGALTTYSTFSYETFTLLRTDRVPTALIYIVASIVGGVLAAAAGYATATRVA